jgi:hypothetical protein
MLGTDRYPGRCVAWLALMIGAAGCPPTVSPPKPPEDPGPIAKTDPGRGRNVTGRQVVVGEMCPQGAAGRPAIAPIMMKTIDWSDRAEDVAAMLERGSTPRFTVLGTDGKSAGTFDTVGVADVGMQASVGVGTYVGASPCTASTGDAAATKSARVEDPACGVATASCGVALAELVRPDDPPETATWASSGACISGDAIAIDVDGDKIAESFPLANVLDPIRGPSQEWTASPTAGASCTPKFSLYDLKLVRPPEAGKPVDTKSIVVLDILAVVDIDGDGRQELVVAMRFPTVRTILVYSAKSTATRLELVGEGESFPR